MNNSRYDAEQRKFLKVLEGLYAPWVRTGICMATIRACNEKPADPCKGPIGYRHAIAKRHLNLIADADNRIRANKDIESFDIWTEQYPELQPVPISRFSAGKWSCQKHDERFAGIDAEHIDLSEPENLFKAVYRVVLRQNHLTAARWSAHWAETETEEGWKRFKETAFREPVSEEEAIKAASEWRNEAQALMSKMRDLERRWANGEWNSLDCRAFLLQSRPSVAGWRCDAVPSADPSHHIELGYMVVIPQQDGHAIITACERDPILPQINRIHHHMPTRVRMDTPYQTDEYLKRRLSSKIWKLNEIGIRESLYQSWSDEEKDRAQVWMKERGPRVRQPPSDLPTFS